MAAATTKAIESFRRAGKEYLKNDRFSDFTIVCEGEEFHVHRCFIAAHSKWFERCCSGMFTENANRRVELKDDYVEVVKCMISFMYTFEYDDAVSVQIQDSAQGRPSNALQMNAWVYAIADKYDMKGLKAVALEKFNRCNDNSYPFAVLEAAVTVYNEIDLPENDAKLQYSLISIWMLQGKRFAEQIGPEIVEWVEALSEFFAAIHTLMMEGLCDDVSQYCAKCHKEGEYSCAEVQGRAYICHNCGRMKSKRLVTMTSTMAFKKHW